VRGIFFTNLANGEGNERVASAPRGTQPSRGADADPARPFYFFFEAIAFCTAVPKSAGVSAMAMPAALSAAILSLAEPEPPEMIARHGPMRRPRGLSVRR